MKKLKRIDLKKMQNLYPLVNDQEMTDLLGGYIKNTDWACQPLTFGNGGIGSGGSGSNSGSTTGSYSGGYSGGY